MIPASERDYAANAFNTIAATGSFRPVTLRPQWKKHMIGPSIVLFKAADKSLDSGLNLAGMTD